WNRAVEKSIRKLTSVVVGVVVTGFGLVSAFLVSPTAMYKLKYILYWQGFLLESLIPSHNIGTTSHPRYEGTPLYQVAFFLGVPVGIVFYSLLSYVLLTFVTRKPSKKIVI